MLVVDSLLSGSGGGMRHYANGLADGYRSLDRERRYVLAVDRAQGRRLIDR